MKNPSLAYGLIESANKFRLLADNTEIVKEVDGELTVKCRINPSNIHYSDLGFLLKNRWGFYNGIWKYKMPEVSRNTAVIEGLHIFEYMIGETDTNFICPWQDAIVISFNDALIPEALPVELKYLLEAMGWGYPINEDQWRIYP